MVKRIFATAVVLLLIGAFAVTALAHPVPDLSENGSITFTMDLDGELLDGGCLNLYQVGYVVENDGNYNFALIEEFAQDNIPLDDLDNPLLSEVLLTYGNVVELSKLSADIKQGKAEFKDVEPGLYVVWQGEKDATEGFAAIQPFLISVPQFKDDTYIMDVVADPKVPLETAPTEPTEPTTPPDKDLPQSGQLNWPVPVLAFGGAVLLIFGIVLRSCGRKERTNA